tara:strand:- start:17 stop:136 length:120 start_codon:yes stop_codon:yes gene_type:complete
MGMIAKLRAQEDSGRADLGAEGAIDEALQADTLKESPFP